MNNEVQVAVTDRVQILFDVCGRLAYIAGEHNTGIEYLIDFALIPWWRFKKRKKLKKLLMEYREKL